MEIKGTPKEIADLVKELQGQPEELAIDSIEFTDGNADDLVKENCHRVKL